MKYFELLRQPAVLTPHWFDDSFKLSRAQPLERYLFPDPLIFRPELSFAPQPKGNDTQQSQHRQSDDVVAKLLLGGVNKPKLISDKERREDRYAIWAGVAAAAAGTKASNSHVPSSQADEGVWAGRRILLSNSLELAAGRRDSVNSQIAASEGVFVDPDDATVADYDILVTTYSEGAEYHQVSVFYVTVGDLAEEQNFCMHFKGYQLQKTCRHLAVALLRYVNWAIDVTR